MRDLRAELRNCDDNVPVEWKPSQGDILVGFVREATNKANMVVIEEERTGTPVMVSLEWPQLAALFELHHPKGRDRVGIKCTDTGEDGQHRFVMLVDRESVAPSQPPLKAQTNQADDDCATATPEERDFIASMLAEEPEEPAADDDASELPVGNIKGILRKQEEELARQNKTLERLEVLISQSAHPSANAAEDAKDQPERKRSWLRIALVIAAMTAACVGGTTYPIWKPMLAHLIR